MEPTQSCMTGGTQNSWDLVWCSEHCQKNRFFRGELDAIATKYSADIISLKKADKFAVWSSAVQRPFVLLADWREAKPCLQTFAKGAQPILTFVYCDNVPSFRRALAWVKHLDRKIYCVRVICNAADLEPLLSQNMGALRGVEHQEFHRIAMAKEKEDETIEEEKAQSEWNMLASVTQHTMIHLMLQCSTSTERRRVEELLVAGMPDHLIEIFKSAIAISELAYWGGTTKRRMRRFFTNF
eukprot:CAMPEP_0169298456 /NCGR_PEP_ID=MMETSP1016-20121227/66493_1 /TAXON_ID=342587 /ORGANISM="Karlodinium micrum, Strain CCMP2283" /LENGTH=239 /DNA_ID=CAMNT_0009390535 /DNA_START=29 /DNA_END=745 /DNA_ORIENTATION=-